MYREIEKILNAKPEATRTRGRPELRWEDGLDNDVEPLLERNWNIQIWHNLLGKTISQKGLFCQVC
jgi:hypothetical protein